MPTDIKNNRYSEFHASERGKKDRAARNKNRREFERKGRVKKGDGKHIDHIDGNPRNNAPSNLRVVPAKSNQRKK